MQFFHVQSCESRSLNASNVSTASLDPKNSLLRSVQRIAPINLRTGISAAKIRNSQIRSEQIRTIAQQFRVIQPAGDLLVPAIFEILQLFCSGLRGHHICLGLVPAANSAHSRAEKRY